MVKLKNIVIEKSAIHCDIYPEDCLQPGRIAIDAKDGKLLEYTLSSGYAWCQNHVRHAREALFAMAKAEEIPAEKLVMWH